MKTSIDIRIGDNNYVVKFPTTGQIIDIEAMKVRLGNDFDVNYISGAYAKTARDMIATFSVLIPDMKKDLTVHSFSELNPIELKPFMEAYLKIYLPWFNEIMDEVSNFDSEIESE